MIGRSAAIALLLALESGAWASSENPGVTAAPVLQIPMGSRAMGMGAAFTAVASDISALYYNPAGLSRLNADEAAATYMTGLADNTLQEFAFGGPLPFSGVSGNGYSGWGSSLLWSHDGTIEVNQTNPDGSFQSTSNLDAGADVVASLGYAERVAATPIDIKEGETYAINHFLGVSAKYIDSTLVQRYSAQAFTMDAGYLANSPETGLTLGLSALNMGGSLKYSDVSDPLPTTFRGGLAYQGGASSDNAFTVAADSYYLMHERQWHADAGVEYFLMKTYGIRLGYQFLQDAVGLTAGFGLRWRSRVFIDYAWTMGSGLADQSRFTITYRFDGVTPAAHARGRSPVINPDAMPDSEHLREGLDQKTPDVDMLPARTPQPAGDSSIPTPGWIY